MKTIFSIIAFIALAFGVASFDFSNGSEHVKTFQAEQTGIVVQKIYHANGIVKTELQLDTAQYSQCDTCSSNLVDAIQLKRKLTDSLTVQNSILYDEFTKSIALTDTLKRIRKMIDLQVLRAKVELARNGKNRL